MGIYAQHRIALKWGLYKIWSKILGLQLAGWTPGTSQGPLEQRQGFVGQAKDQPCGNDGGALSPFLPEQEKLSGENMRMFERKKGTVSDKECQHCWRAEGWALCCKGVTAGRLRLRLSALWGTQWLCRALLPLWRCRFIWGQTRSLSEGK